MTNIVEKQIRDMLQLQDQMNTRVNEDWREQNYQWYRAIWTECAELMDHYGWKWWKKQEPDMEQVRLEVVDLWHFGLSDLMNRPELPTETVVEVLVDEWGAICDSQVGLDVLTAIEKLAHFSLDVKKFSIYYFFLLMKACGMSMDDLYKAYIGKNVLNFFRQDHGYKEGTYVKEWGGKEDNEHLAEILELLDPSSESFKDDVYNALSSRYVAWVA